MATVKQLTINSSTLHYAARLIPAVGIITIAGSFFLAGGIPAMTLLIAVSILFYGRETVDQLHRSGAGHPHMQEVASAIQLAVMACLRRHYRLMALMAVSISVILLWFTQWIVVSGFLLGLIFSAAAIFFAMTVAVRCNLRIANANSPTDQANRCGLVTALCATAIALAGFSVFYIALTVFEAPRPFHALAAYALGCSVVAFHARLGGSLLVKTSVMAMAELERRGSLPVGRHDPRNMATMVEQASFAIAEVGGTTADFTETLVLGLAASMLTGALLAPDMVRLAELPMLLQTLGLAALAFAFLKPLRHPEDPCPAIPGKMPFVSLMVLLGFAVLAYLLLDQSFIIAGEPYKLFRLLCAVLLGLLLGLACFFVRVSKRGADNPWLGLVQLREGILPLILTTAVLWWTSSFAGTYGVMMTVMASLSLFPGMLAVHTLWPLLSNAAEINHSAGEEQTGVEMYFVCREAGSRVAASNAFAIVLTFMVVWQVFVAYAKSVSLSFSIDLLDTRVMVGLMLGGLIPYVMGMTVLDAAKRPAAALMQEIRRQYTLIPGILAYRARPEYARCMEVLTQSVFAELIIPGVLPLTMVLGGGWLLGREALSGMMVGAAVVGFFVAFFRSSWGQSERVVQQTMDSVKDKLLLPVEPAGGNVVLSFGAPEGLPGLTGPMLNPVIKLTAIASLVVAVLG